MSEALLVRNAVIQQGIGADPKEIILWFGPYTGRDCGPVNYYIAALQDSFPDHKIRMLYRTAGQARHYHADCLRYFAGLRKAPVSLVCIDPLLSDFRTEPNDALTGLPLLYPELPFFFDFLKKVSMGEFPMLSSTRIVGIEKTTIRFATDHIWDRMPGAIRDNPNFVFGSMPDTLPVELVDLLAPNVRSTPAGDNGGVFKFSVPQPRHALEGVTPQQGLFLRMLRGAVSAANEGRRLTPPQAFVLDWAKVVSNGDDVFADLVGGIIEANSAGIIRGR